MRHAPPFHYIPKSSKLTRPDKTGRAQVKATRPGCCPAWWQGPVRKNSSLRSSRARTVVTLPVLADCVRRPAGKNKRQVGRETSSGQKSITARGSAYRRGQGISTARLRPVPVGAGTPAIVVRSVISAPPPLRTLITADRNNRTHSADQNGPRPRRWTLRPASSGLTLTPANRPSFRAVPAPGTQIRCHRAIATIPGQGTRRPDKIDAGFAALLACRNGRRLRCSQAARLGRRPCCRDRTQHILCVTLRSFIPDAQGTPRPCAGSK